MIMKTIKTSDGFLWLSVDRDFANKNFQNYYFFEVDKGGNDREIVSILQLNSCFDNGLYCCIELGFECDIESVPNQ